MAPKRKKKPSPPARVTPPTQVASGRMAGSSVTEQVDPSLNNYQGQEAPYLAAYERALRIEPTFSAATGYLVLAMLASIGEYQHDDPAIQAFIRKNFARMEGNLYQVLGDLIHSALWSGKGVSEMLLEARKGYWWLKGIVNYHPASISLVPNRRGLLTDNQSDVLPGTTFPRTGVWQRLPGKLRVGLKGTNLVGDHVRIPLSKAIVVRHNAHHGSMHGQSLFAPAWVFYEMKWKTLQDWMVTSEKYGAPTLAAIVPSGLTSSMVPDGSGGSRPQTVAEGAKDALSNMRSADGLVFERPAGSDKNDLILQTLTTGNNFGDSYKLTVKETDFQMFTAMKLPPLLFMEHTGGLGAGEISQTQADNFKQLQVSLYRQFIEPFTEQCVGRLVRWNFGVEDYGHFPFKPFDPGASMRLMQTTELALKAGLIDTSEEADLQHGRGLIGWAAADGEQLARMVKGNKKLMETFRSPEAVKLAAAKVSAEAVVRAAEINNGWKEETSFEELELSKQDLALREKDLKHKQKVDKQKGAQDHELKVLTAEHQHQQNMTAIRKGLVATPAPAAPKAPKPSAPKKKAS